MKKTIISLAMSSCFVLGTSFAHADSDSSHGDMNNKTFKMDQKTLKAMDKDSDGKITKEEFKNYTKMKNVSDYDVWDVDGSGDINAWEMKIVSERNAGQQPSGGQTSGGNSGEAGNSSLKDAAASEEEMNTAHNKLNGSGSVRNKRDDEGKDPKGKERSTNMSGDMDHQSVRHGDSERSQSERTRTGSSRGNSGEAGNVANKNAAAPGKVLKQDRLKIENRDDAMDPTGSAGKSSSPSGS